MGGYMETWFYVVETINFHEYNTITMGPQKCVMFRFTFSFKILY